MKGLRASSPKPSRQASCRSFKSRQAWARMRSPRGMISGLLSQVDELKRQESCPASGGTSEPMRIEAGDLSVVLKSDDRLIERPQIHLGRERAPSTHSPTHATRSHRCRTLDSTCIVKSEAAAGGRRGVARSTGSDAARPSEASVTMQGHSRPGHLLSASRVSGNQLAVLVYERDWQIVDVSSMTARLTEDIPEARGARAAPPRPHG